MIEKLCLAQQHNMAIILAERYKEMTYLVLCLFSQQKPTVKDENMRYIQMFGSDYYNALVNYLYEQSK